jgi:hypothetical protein
MPMDVMLLVLNQPEQGFEFDLMKNSRARFKLTIRYNRKQHQDSLRADAHACIMAENYYKVCNFSLEGPEMINPSTHYASYVGDPRDANPCCIYNKDVEASFCATTCIKCLLEALNLFEAINVYISCYGVIIL